MVKLYAFLLVLTLAMSSAKSSALALPIGRTGILRQRDLVEFSGREYLLDGCDTYDVLEARGNKAKGKKKTQEDQEPLLGSSSSSPEPQEQPKKPGPNKLKKKPQAQAQESNQESQAKATQPKDKHNYKFLNAVRGGFPGLG